jgi:hypothetical protein
MGQLDSQLFEPHRCIAITCSAALAVAAHVELFVKAKSETGFSRDGHNG